MPTWLLLPEDDNTLTEEEKAVARFQKERLKATGGAAAVHIVAMPLSLTCPVMRPFTLAHASKGWAREAIRAVFCDCSGDKFTLGDEDEELTHMGRSLASGEFEVRCTMIYYILVESPVLVELTCQPAQRK